MSGRFRCNEQALAIFRETGDRRSEGNVLGFLGNLHHVLGNRSEALRYLLSSIALTEQTVPIVVAISQGTLACIRAEQGRVEEARALLDASESRIRGKDQQELVRVGRTSRVFVRAALRPPCPVRRRGGGVCRAAKWHPALSSARPSQGGLRGFLSPSAPDNPLCASCKGEAPLPTPFPHLRCEEDSVRNHLSEGSKIGHQSRRWTVCRAEMRRRR